MPEGYLRARASAFHCANCKRRLQDCRFVGIGFQFIRPRPIAKPKLMMRICVQCSKCDEVGTIGVEANPKLWEECQTHVLKTNCRDPFGPGSVAHIQAMADHPSITPQGESSKQTKSRNSKRKNVVRPSIRPETPATQITWEEVRKFLRQTSLRRSTKTFQKWIKRMAPDESTDNAPPF